MATIYFKANEPQILKLADPRGEATAVGKFYATTDGQLVLLPWEAAGKLIALGVQPGEEISITYMEESWVICLTPRSEKARADAEIAAQELRARQLAQETRENPGRQLENSLAALRQLPKSANSASQEPAETPRGNGTTGPAPAIAVAPRKRQNPPIDRVSYRVALREITGVVVEMLAEKGEQWTDQAKQDAISTVFISAAKSGGIVFDFAGGDQ